MGLFDSDTDIDWHLIPSTPEQKRARKFGQRLYTRDVKYPEREVVGPTPLQRELSDYTRAILPELQRTMAGYYDPQTGPHYRGLRQESERLKGEAITGVRRGAQMGGMLRASPTRGLEAETSRRYDSALLQELGNLLENERSRRLQTAQAMPQVLSAAQQAAGAEQRYEQEQANAAYNAMIQTMLFPYTYQWQIASAILGEQRFVGVPERSPSTYEKIKGWTDIAGMAAGAYTGGMKGAGY